MGANHDCYKQFCCWFRLKTQITSIHFSWEGGGARSSLKSHQFLPLCTVECTFFSVSLNFGGGGNLGWKKNFKGELSLSSAFTEAYLVEISIGHFVWCSHRRCSPVLQPVSILLLSSFSLLLYSLSILLIFTKGPIHTGFDLECDDLHLQSAPCVMWHTFCSLSSWWQTKYPPTLQA